MVAEQCFDLWDDTGQFDFQARRCVQCGELVDPVILKNRRLRLPKPSPFRVRRHDGATCKRSSYLGC